MEYALPSTESLRRITTKAAHIRADDGDLVQRCKLQDLTDGESVPKPSGNIVCGVFSMSFAPASNASI